MDELISLVNWSRGQFALTAMYHWIFVPITLGLTIMIAIMPVSYTHLDVYKRQVGMGHTRWATHGEPTDINAHPHFSPSHKLAIIHNGIIENYKTLKEELISRDYQFKSETDTEVIIHLVEDIIKNEHVDIVEATRLALSQVIGAFAIVILSENNPDMLIAAKRGSPLVICLLYTSRCV